MESKDKLKETDIKNRTCYYFDDIIRFWDRDIAFSDISLDKKLYKGTNILTYDISYNTSTRAKSLVIGFDEKDGFIKVNDKIRY